MSGWYITNRAAGISAPAQVVIYDRIAAGGAAAMLASLGDAREADLRINSEGGSLFEALTVYNRLLDLDRVTVVVDGIAASAASVIAMAASPGCLAMAPRSRMMIHEARVEELGGGTADQLAAMSAVLDGLSDEIAGVYADRSGKPASYWRQLMRNETWFSPAEAVLEGLADTALDGPWSALIREQVVACLTSYYREGRIW